MTLTVNGEAKTLEDASLTINELLEKLDIPVEHIAVEVNRDIVPKARFAETGLNDGDVIEIVRFVGGGKS
ncbi:MAG: sulfur carrier protein ThiS [Spirochaetota bacterium]|nr:sulfur carrier protein ThiS [Spirochaetota bacterium]